MIDAKVAILGFIITVTISLNGLGVFTPEWILVENKYYSTLDSFTGLIPFHHHESLWFAISSWLMFSSFAVYILTVLLYTHIFLKADKIGMRRQLRSWFLSISCFSVLAIVLTVAGVSIIGVHCSYNYYVYKWKLGYSAWLCVASACLTIGTVYLSAHIANKECRD